MGDIERPSGAGNDHNGHHLTQMDCRDYEAMNTGEMMNADSTTIATTAVQIADAETEEDLSLDAEFHYDPADPLAVTMVIESFAGPVTWTFARDLIMHGRFEPTGDGDVHVWPCLNTEGAAVVIVELDVPAGSVMLQFPSRTIQEFVLASLAAVPMGAEQYDLDNWVEQLLAGTDIVAEL